MVIYLYVYLWKRHIVSFSSVCLFFHLTLCFWVLVPVQGQLITWCWVLYALFFHSLRHLSCPLLPKMLWWVPAMHGSLWSRRMFLVTSTRVDRTLDNTQTEFHPVQSHWLLEGLISTHANQDSRWDSVFPILDSTWYHLPLSKLTGIRR